MPELAIKTRKEIFAEMLDDITNTATDIVAETPGDDMYDISWAGSAALADTNETLSRAVDESMDDTAGLEALKKRNQHRIGAPDTATPAQLSVTITGAAGSSWTTADRLTGEENGWRYAPTGGGTMPAGGSAAAVVECLTGGDAGALASGARLTFDIVPAGLDQVVITSGKPIGGSNAETRDEYRERVFDFFQEPTAPGTLPWFERKILAVNGVGHAAAVADRRALGTIDVAVLDHEGDACSAAVLAAAQTYYDQIRPPGCKGGLIVNPAKTGVVVQRRLELAPGYTLSSFAAKVAQSGSTLTTVYLNSVADIAAGDWIAVAVVVQGRTRFVARQVYQALSAGSQHYVTLVSKLPAAPAAGVVARPGCPTFDQLARSIQDYFDTIKSGGTFYNADCDRYLKENIEVSDIADVLPAANVEAVVNTMTFQHLFLSDLILEAI